MKIKELRRKKHEINQYFIALLEALPCPISENMFLLEQKPKMGFHNSVPLEPLLMRERSRDGGRGSSVMESIFIAIVITVILCR